jgi:hypothetical protein
MSIKLKSLRRNYKRFSLYFLLYSHAKFLTIHGLIKSFTITSFSTFSFRSNIYNSHYRVLRIGRLKASRNCQNINNRRFSPFVYVTPLKINIFLCYEIEGPFTLITESRSFVCTESSSRNAFCCVETGTI